MTLRTSDIAFKISVPQGKTSLYCVLSWGKITAEPFRRPRSTTTDTNQTRGPAPQRNNQNARNNPRNTFREQPVTTPRRSPPSRQYNSRPDSYAAATRRPPPNGQYDYSRPDNYAVATRRPPPSNGQYDYSRTTADYSSHPDNYWQRDYYRSEQDYYRSEQDYYQSEQNYRPAFYHNY